MTDKTFKTLAEFDSAITKVYDFHKTVYNTVLDYLKQRGDRTITDEDNKYEQWRFVFIAMEGEYTVNAIRLDESGEDFYLDCTSESGDNYHIGWPDINHDMTITEMLMGLVLNDRKYVKKEWSAMLNDITNAARTLNFTDEIDEIETLAYIDKEGKTWEDRFDHIDTTTLPISIAFIGGTGHKNFSIPIGWLTQESIERLYECIDN